MFPFQAASSVECYSDTDWSGCTRTRKSTSGGCLMLGRHVLKTWSATQPSVSLSSAEAEFYGVVKAAGLALGQQSILRDLGLELPVRVWTDSSAAMGICARHGLGKLRHIATHTLWVQEKVRNKEIDLRKVRGEVNPADVFTKHLTSQERIESLMKLFGCEFRGGRPAGAPQLKREKAEGMGELNVHEDDFYHAEMHDPDVLPHEYNNDDIEKLFPRAIAPPTEEDEEELSRQAEEKRAWDIGRPRVHVSVASSAAPAASTSTALSGPSTSITLAAPTAQSSTTTMAMGLLPRKIGAAQRMERDDSAKANETGVSPISMLSRCASTATAFRRRSCSGTSIECERARPLFRLSRVATHL